MSWVRIWRVTATLLFASASMVGVGACSCGEGGVQGLRAAAKLDFLADPSGQADYLIDFGVVPVGSRSLLQHEITNEGSAPLRIQVERVIQPFSLNVPAEGLTIGVGASASIGFGFAPMEPSVEPLEVVLHLSTNERGGVVHSLRLVGTAIRPSLDCDPASLDFGTVLKGSEQRRTVVCTNRLEAELEVKLGEFEGSYRRFYSSALPGSAGSVAVPTGASIEVSIQFRAESLGSNRTSLPILDRNDQLLALVSIDATTAANALQLDPSICLDFGYVAPGGVGRKAFLIRNQGAAPRTLVGAKLLGSGAADFSVVEALPLPLPAGGSAVELTLEFRPRIAGSVDSTIELRTSPEDGEPLVGCVRGFGGGPALVCDRASVDFGVVSVGAPVRRSYACVNAGTAPAGTVVDPLWVASIRSDQQEFTAQVRNLDGSEGPKAGGYALDEGFFVEIEYAPAAEGFDAGRISLELKGGDLHETLVSGEGRLLPPCQFSVLPPKLPFGVVARGSERELSFGIENHLETSCLINDLRISPGSDAAFSVEPIESLELAGLSTLKIPVRFAPIRYQASITGVVEFQISDPLRSRQEVQLSGIAAEPCLLLDPAELDFGSVEPGCRTPERILALRNTCTSPITITEIELSDAMGSEHFDLGRRPILPRLLLPNEWAEITLFYSPTSLGLDRGAVSIEVETAPGERQRYLGGLVGEGALGAWQTDTFEQMEAPKVDILWVIDNSGSMTPYQEKLRANLPSFLSYANAQQIDYHLAVTSTGLVAEGDCPGGAMGGEDGRFFPIDGSHPRILSRTTPNMETHWDFNANVGICHTAEHALEAAFRSLSSPLIHEAKSSKHGTAYNDGNAGFLRRDASLSIIFLTDEVEQSYYWGKGPAQYLEFFRSVKGEQNHHMLKVHAIAGGWGAAPTPACQAVAAGGLLTLVEETDGLWMDICTPATDEAWSVGLSRMSEGAFGFSSRFFLRGQPGDANGDLSLDEDDLEVSVDGKVFAPFSDSQAQVWTYDARQNAIEFTPLFVPKRGSQVAVNYQVACLSP